MVAPKLAAKQETPSTYITGFCSIGGHENTNHLSPSGKSLRVCPTGGRFEDTDGSGQRVRGVLECACDCHTVSRQMEEMTGVKFPVFSSRRTSPPLSGLGLLSGTTTGTIGAGASGSVDVERPTVALPSGARFVVTPTGRAARGQLEEQVRYAICVQVKQAGEDMIAILGLNTNMLAKLINPDDQPSTGAIYSVLKRWDGANLVELGESPFRFLRFTDRGKRELFY